MDAVRTEPLLTRRELLDRVTRAYVELYRNAVGVAERPRVAERIFNRGWETLRAAGRWEDGRVSGTVHAAIADLLDRIQYVSDEEGLLTWLDTLPRTAREYLEPAEYELQISELLLGIQKTFRYSATAHVAGVPETGGFRVRVSGQDGGSDAVDPSKPDLVAA